MDKSLEDMLKEATRSNLFPEIKWDGVEWFCNFDKGDGTIGWEEIDEDLARAVKKTYFSWKGIYFNEDVD